MTRLVRSAPAPKWRAFFMLGGLALNAFAATPGGQLPPDLAQVGKPTAAEAREIIAQFQNAGLPGEYYFEFELRVLPRRGEDYTLRGKLWGGHNEQGAITRIAVVDRTGRESRFLLQNGTRAALWSYVGGQLAPRNADGWFEPLVPGVQITPFDLQLPFFYWPDFTVQELVRMSGRPTQVFFFRPPPAFARQYAAISGVRAFLDTQYNAPVQTELVGADGKVAKTLSLVELKRVGGQTIPRAVDVRDDLTRDKTRFQVMAVALNLDLPPGVFQPATLASETKPPAPERVTRFAP